MMPSTLGPIAFPSSPIAGARNRFLSRGIGLGKKLAKKKTRRAREREAKGVTASDFCSERGNLRTLCDNFNSFAAGCFCSFFFSRALCGELRFLKLQSGERERDFSILITVLTYFNKIRDDGRATRSFSGLTRYDAPLFQLAKFSDWISRDLLPSRRDNWFGNFRAFQSFCRE